MNRIQIASPFEGEVGPQDRVGGDGSAFYRSSDLRRHTPHPSMLRIADLPFKGGGENQRENE